MDEIGKKYRAFQLSIEPSNETGSQLLKNNGYKLSKSPSLGSKTVQIDLRRSEKNDKKTWHSRFRSKIHLVIKKILQIKNIEDLEDVDATYFPHIREVSDPWMMNKDGKKGLVIERMESYKSDRAKLCFRSSEQVIGEEGIVIEEATPEAETDMVQEEVKRPQITYLLAAVLVLTAGIIIYSLFRKKHS